METRNKKRKDPIDPPNLIPIPPKEKNNKHIFFDDEDDEEEYLPSSSDDDDDDEDDDDFLYYINEKNTEFLDEEDLTALETLKKQSPEMYDRFVLAKEIIKSRELSITDLLKCSMSDDKRANLIELYEILRQTPPCTEEYLELRDKIRNLYFKYVSDYINPPSVKVAVSPSILKIPKSDLQHEVSMFKKKIYQLECSTTNLRVFEEKLNDYEEIEKGDEKSKLKRWLNLSTQLPFDRLSLNENHTDMENLEKRLQHTGEYMDKHLFGMKNVKERILLFLNKKFREGGSRGCNIALVGKPGVGKCLHPDTPVMLYDMTVKKAKEIKEGDLLMGDDESPRLVLSTVKGREEMYEIVQECGENYIVNKSHILSMKNKHDETVEDIQLLDFITGRKNVHDYTPYYTYYTKESKEIKKNIKEIGRELASPFPNTYETYETSYLYEYDLYKTLDRFRKIEFLSGLIEGSEYTKYENDNIHIYLSMDCPVKNILDILRSGGIRCKFNANGDGSGWLICKDKRMNEKWDFSSIGEGEYCGFVIDGNERFVLGDWTVTHNTAIAKSLAECLRIPFAQLSFGGVTNVEFLMGHDYTYIGSRPGEITRCLIRLGVKNGILFFDEFDKATDKKDIMSTLLHITDFTQNSEFRDNYFPELTQDLSKLWFIYSMNELPTDPAMLDRLEVIHVDEYTSEERVKIATDYLFPKYMREISLKEMVLTPEGIKKIVDYSSNGLDKKGVRDLERYINLVIEKIYFYSCNRNGSYDYPWYKKINENVDVETGKIILSEQLVESILKENLKEKDGRYVYLNMYM